MRCVFQGLHDAKSLTARGKIVLARCEVGIGQSDKGYTEGFSPDCAQRVCHMDMRTATVCCRETLWTFVGSNELVRV